MIVLRWTLLFCFLSCTSAMFLGRVRVKQLTSYYREPPAGFIFMANVKQSGNQSCPGAPSLKFGEEFFSQKIDHFNPADKRQFDQRYFVQGAYFKPTAEGENVLLLVGGESPIDARLICSEEYPAMKIAKESNALVLNLEHRFFGNTKPLDLLPESLKFLSSKQALADLAAFIEHVIKKRGMRNPKIVLYAGSYPGSLAARMRVVYPRHSQGSIASSAPLLPLHEFTDYSNAAQAVIKEVHGECALAVADVFTEFLSKLRTPEGRAELNQKLSVDPPLAVQNAAEADLNVASACVYDQFLTLVQSYSASNDRLKPACKTFTWTGAEKLQRLKKFFANAAEGAPIITSFEQAIAPFKYPDYSRDPNSTALHDPDTRAWFFLLCTEFGWFQPSSGIFSTAAPMDYYLRICKDLFGILPDEYRRRVDESRKEYGGLDDFNGTNTLFVHNSFDPWHTLGVKKSVHEKHVISRTTPGTSHCRDQLKPRNADSNELKETRELVAAEVRRLFALPSAWNQK